MITPQLAAAYASQQAPVAAPPVQAPPPPPPLTLDEKNQWNGFVDYLKKRGVGGSAALDNRDTNMGQQLMEEYRKQNPHFTLGYDRVGDVQQDLQNYRQSLVQKYKANPAIIPGIKDESEIMGGLSPVDNWLGSKTSMQRYPGATLTQSDGSVQNFGLNQAAYDAAIANMKKAK